MGIWQVALQVDFRVWQLPAVNPDSPLGISKRGEYQHVGLHLERAGGAYRKTMPVSFLGTFLLINTRVLFTGTLKRADAKLKVPAPEPPATNWD